MFMLMDFDPDDGGSPVLIRLGFETPMAATRYNQRFGKPGWRVVEADLLSLDEVNAMPPRVRKLQAVEVGIDGGL